MRNLVIILAIFLIAGCGSKVETPKVGQNSTPFSSCMEVCDTGFNDQGPDLKDCQDHCYFNEGKRSGDISQCAKIGPEGGDLADSCVEVTAETAKDASFCSKAVDPTYRLNCIRAVAVAKGDPSVCDLVVNDQEFKDSCISYVASDKKDPTICDRISNNETKTQCKQYAS